MKWQQFLQDDKGFFSAARLGYLASLVMASLIMWVLVGTGHMTEGYFAIYTGTFALGYVGGKWVGGRNVSRSNKRV